MNIIFNKIIIRNFQSYGDIPTEFHLNRSPSTLITGKNGSGKAQPLDSLICTPSGFVRMGDINIGDYVSNPDGSYTKVTHIFPQGIQKVYKVTLKDGATVKCTGDHLWSGKFRGTNLKGVYTLDEVNELMNKHSTKFILPEIKPVEFYESFMFMEVDFFQVGSSLSRNEWHGIDDEYKQTSVSNRYELLRGLLETANYNVGTGCIEYNCNNKILMNDIKSVVESLGGYGIITDYGISVKVRNKHLITGRKTFKMLSENYDRLIERIEYLEDAECQCIRVEHENHLYITDNFIPTHNSSLIEAFVFGLSGKSYRGSNKQELINTINQRDCVVELHFTVGIDECVIVRGMKPNIFYITKNGKKIEESASIKDMQKYLETYILKASVSGIISISVLGCNYKPFMIMTSKEKRDLIDILLDISDFGEMSKLLKVKISQFKEEVSEYQTALKMAELELAGKSELLEQAKRNKDEVIENDKDELKLLAKRIKECESLITIKKDELSQLVFEEDMNDINLRFNNIDKELHLINSKIKENMDTIKNFKKLGSHCNHCGQDVTAEHTEKHIAEYEAKIVSLGVDKQKYDTDLKQLSYIKQSYAKYVGDKNLIQNELNSLELGLDNIKKLAISKVKKHKNLCVEEKPDIEKYEAEYLEVKENYDILIGKESQFIKMRSVYLLATNLLKDDGIKSNIVNQYIPVLSQSINYYLGVMNSHITFNIDKNLDVRLDSRYKGEFSYHALSMGERQRIDLANTFAWRKVASVKNSVSTNVLFMDETFDASIDSDGVDDLLTILEDFRKESVNVFVISHKGNMDDKLRGMIKIEKRNGFSKIV